MGKKQTIKLPAAVDENAPDKDNLNIIRNEEIKSVVKRRQKLRELLMKVCVCVLTQPPEDEDHWPLPPIKAGWHLSPSP